MKVLLLRIHPAVGLGTFETLLAARGCGIVHARADRAETLPRPDAFAAVFVGGTPDSIRDLERHAGLIAAAAFLRRCLDAGTPLLGICGGAQLLAHLFGEPVTRAPRAELGRREMRLTRPGIADPLLAGFPERFHVFEWHSDTFALPRGATLLAEGADCPNQLFRRDRVVGLQFHIEFTASAVADLADAHPGALMGRGRDEIVAECRAIETPMARLADRLLGNFLGLARGA